MHGWRWWCCGSTQRLPSRQHVIGSIFKCIRQAEKTPLAQSPQTITLWSGSSRVLARNSCKVAVTSEGDPSALLKHSGACQLSLKLPAWCDVTSTDGAQSVGWQHVQSDTFHLRVWPQDWTNTQRALQTWDWFLDGWPEQQQNWRQPNKTEGGWWGVYPCIKFTLETALTARKYKSGLISQQNSVKLLNVIWYGLRRKLGIRTIINACLYTKTYSGE